ncbi:DUF2569 domain-containing protein [Citrobacter sp. JGM124]|uniref:DUF2569 domain-containing protein n=1 Tax=Citrobacter sp. JGM124 TaxID=2799789 RepID=UPI001BA7CAA3|nr:DUF2569 domain-containing protein [Citrobacter sp. JGM124]MBS0847458.1 DUF2569 domain-containing protein [Citrobacter sp. JGM124]
MTVKPPRIAGWLLAPLAWLLMSLISSSLAVAIYGMMLLAPDTHQMMAAQGNNMLFLWYFSVICALAMWCYTLWLTVAFFKRRRNVVRHYILWLMLSLILAIKAFALSPVSDSLALRQLMFPLLAAALAVPYLKRSKRVKETFINP